MKIWDTAFCCLWFKESMNVCLFFNFRKINRKITKCRFSQKLEHKLEKQHIQNKHQSFSKIGTQIIFFSFYIIFPYSMARCQSLLPAFLRHLPHSHFKAKLKGDDFYERRLQSLLNLLSLFVNSSVSRVLPLIQSACSSQQPVKLI